MVDVAEKESGEREALDPPLGSTAGIEIQETATALIARHPQIHCVPDIRPELDGMVALAARPVVYNLELLFAFRQGAVAAANIEPIAKVRKYAWAPVISISPRAHQKAR